MNNITKYGNLVSGIMANTKAKPEAQIGDEATVLRGRDRAPAKIVEILRGKKGITGYMLQAYRFTVDLETEGYAKEIRWDEPNGHPSKHMVKTRGKLKGTVEDAFMGHADAFYDRSF